MSARAPDAIRRLWADVHTFTPTAALGGIVGDPAHSYGYHLARRDLSTSDYSVTLPLDQRGASDCASALDITLPPDLMITYTRRLLAAAKAHDPRLRGLREFCGTLDGKHTYPWDLHTGASEGIDTWDDSHLWHIHLSFYRAYADRYDVLAPIADVLVGTPDFLEELMSFYSSRADFEDALRRIVHDEVAVKGVKVAGMTGWDDNDGTPGRDVHNPETLFRGIPGYQTVLARETAATKPAAGK